MTAGFESTQPLLTILSMIVGGIFSLLFAQRARIPSILPLLIVGVVLGPRGVGLVRPEVFQSNLTTYISLLAALVLFEGGTSLKKDQLRHISGPVRNLLTLGAAVTWIGGTVAARALLTPSWGVAVLFGALLIVTGPTVIAPILRRVPVRERLHNVLKWEAILVDPIGVVAAVVAFEFFLAPRGNLGESLALFGGRLALGGALGALAGLVITVVPRKSRLFRFEGDEYGGLFVLAVVLFFFGISNLMLPETGLVVATLAGIFAGNASFPSKEEILGFARQLTHFALSVLFILLAANIPIEDMGRWALRSTALLGIMIVLVRPAAALLSLRGKQGLPWNEALFVSFFAPRGIVTAALASLFAATLEKQSPTDTAYFLPSAFFVVVGSILFYTLTSPWFSRALGVREAAGKDVAIVGANPLGLLLARELRREDIAAVFIDTTPGACDIARREGFPAHVGSGFNAKFLVSLDLKGIGQMVALTPNDEANMLSCRAFFPLLGKARVFRLWGTRDRWEELSSAGYDPANGRPLLLPPRENLTSIFEELEKKRARVARRTTESEWTLSPQSLHEMGVTWPLYVVVKGNIVFPQPDAALPAGSTLVYITFSNSRFAEFLKLFRFKSDEPEHPPTA